MTGALLAALVGLALGLRLTWAWGDLETLLRYATSDDAYYYFQIAREWVAGNPVSLDGETATNGFHPLWLACIAAIQCVVRDAETALRTGLGLGAVLGAASVVPLHRVVLRATGSQAAALFAAALYAVHPTAVTESVNGLETALVVFATACVTERFLTLAERGADVRGALAFGLIGGALMLARTDGVFLWGALLVWLAGTRRELGLPLVAGAVSTACVAPWLLWNLLTFGEVMQVSALALPEALQADYLAAHGNTLAARIDRSAFLVARAFSDQLPHLYLMPRGLPLWPALLASAILGGAVLRDATARRRAAPLAAPVAAVLFTLLWHAGVRWWTREWYFAPAGWMLAVCAGIGAAQLLRAAEAAAPAWRRAARAGLAAAAALILAALAAPPLAAGWRIASEHRVQQLEAARWLATRTPPDARVGAFNAGIYSYFSGRTVVNLDGAVNADAYAARREGRLLDYAIERRLEYVADWRGTLPMLGCAVRTDVRCERIATIGEPLPNFAGSPIRVLRLHVEPPGMSR